MKITETALEAISNSIECRNALALTFGKHTNSVDRWVSKKSKMYEIYLTHPKAVEQIMKYTGLTESQILTK